MQITPELFDACLKCPTKCWLLANNELASGNDYADWVRSREESYRVEEMQRQLAGRPTHKTVVNSPANSLKTATWQIALDVSASFQLRSNRSVMKANKLVIWPAPPACPKCGEEKIYKHVPDDKTVFDLRFSKSGVKRWVTRFDFYRYRCTRCKAVLHNPERAWSRDKFGWNLCAFVAYQVVDLRLPQETVASLLNRLFGFNFCRGTGNKLKVAAAEFYQETYDNFLKRIVAGRLVHADETAVDFKSRRGYIRAFTNLDEVAFVFADSREGDTAQTRPNLVAAEVTRLKLLPPLAPTCDSKPNDQSLLTSAVQGAHRFRAFNLSLLTSAATVRRRRE